MNCDRFDPITGSVAPCCVVCSHRGACEKENAAPVLEHRDGKAEPQPMIPPLLYEVGKGIVKYER